MLFLLRTPLFYAVLFCSMSAYTMRAPAKCHPAQHHNQQLIARPQAWHATYHDPILGRPIRVRYAPTKQEILEHDIQAFLHMQHDILPDTIPNTVRGQIEYAAHCAALFTRALMHGSARQAQLLLAANADPNVPDLSGDLPLHTATQYTNISTLQLLVSAKADVHARNKHGNTALHVAAHKENPALICALLDAGANPESLDQHGETVLMYLEKRKREYLSAQEECEQKNGEYARENNGEQQPTFQAVMQNLKEKIDILYTLEANLQAAAHR